MEEPVVACSLSEQQLEKRRAELRAGLSRRIRRVRTLDDGISFAFDRSPENARDLAAFIEFETGCCGFARMSLRDDSSADASWLEIRGPAGTVEIFGQMVPAGMAVEPAEMRRGLLRHTRARDRDRSARARFGGRCSCRVLGGCDGYPSARGRGLDGRSSRLAPALGGVAGRR